MNEKQIEEWYHQWNAGKNKSGIATINVLDMLKDFAKEYQSNNVPQITDGMVKHIIDKIQPLPNNLDTLSEEEISIIASCRTSAQLTAKAILSELNT